MSLVCLDGPDGCAGAVEYRMALSGTGTSFLRCDAHWGERLDEQERIDMAYPVHAPRDFNELDAGERWEED